MNLDPISCYDLYKDVTVMQFTPSKYTQQSTPKTPFNIHRKQVVYKSVPKSTLSYSQSLLSLDRQLNANVNANNRALGLFKTLSRQSQRSPTHSEIKSHPPLDRPYSQTSQPLLKFSLKSVHQQQKIRINRQHSHNDIYKGLIVHQNHVKLATSNDPIKTRLKGFWEPKESVNKNRDIRFFSRNEENQKFPQNLVKTLKCGQLYFLAQPYTNVPWDQKFKFSKSNCKRLYEIFET